MKMLKRLLCKLLGHKLIKDSRIQVRKCTRCKSSWTEAYIHSVGRLEWEFISTKGLVGKLKRARRRLYWKLPRHVRLVTRKGTWQLNWTFFLIINCFAFIPYGRQYCHRYIIFIGPVPVYFQVRPW